MLVVCQEWTITCHGWLALAGEVAGPAAGDNGSYVFDLSGRQRAIAAQLPLVPSGGSVQGDATVECREGCDHICNMQHGCENRERVRLPGFENLTSCVAPPAVHPFSGLWECLQAQIVNVSYCALRSSYISQTSRLLQELTCYKSHPHGGGPSGGKGATAGARFFAVEFSTSM